MSGLTTGEVARDAGVNIETMRYYERRGLVPTPPRAASNYRIYPEDTVKRVLFIKRAQELGFSLKEIKGLLALRTSSRTKCGEIRARVTEKIEDIDEKIGALQAIRKALSTLAAECPGKGPVTECPILESLDAENAKRTRR